jgi:outer membrane protein assembly factor BamB
MNLKLTEKDINLLKVVSQISGGFTLIVALTMIFSLIQLKVINPLDSPALLSVKEQFDKDPANAAKAEQVRAMDLMARKAYFSSRWQVEAGSYLLLAGGIIFILCQRLISGQEKRNPLFSEEKPVSSAQKKGERQYLLVAASVICLTAVTASFVMRTELPGLAGQSSAVAKEVKVNKETAPKPDDSNWPFFRGHNSQGIAGGSNYPTEWDGASGKNIDWKISTPKPGKSSPVIWDDKIFVTGAQDKICEIYCIKKKYYGPVQLPEFRANHPFCRKWIRNQGWQSRLLPLTGSRYVVFLPMVIFFASILMVSLNGLKT